MAFDDDGRKKQSSASNRGTLAQVFIPRTIKIAGRALETTPVFDAYWYFAAERQRIFFDRVVGSNARTHDPILAAFKFTNAYRASDRVSQYLIRNVIYRDDLPSDPENVFFRTMLFKIFNKIETWEALEREFGALSLHTYRFDAFDAFLTHRQDNGQRNYAAAYIMPSAGNVFGFRRKHSNHLRLIEWMLRERFVDRLRQASSMRDAFALLASAPSLGPFLAFQFTIDINYGPVTDFSERDFVVAGPGALDGISKCFIGARGVPPSAIIAHMADHQHDYFAELKIDFRDLWGRELQLVDCQNLFCEISKYARAAFPEIGGLSGRTRIKQKFRPAGRVPTPWYPPKWHLDVRMPREGASHSEVGLQAAKAVQYTLF
jgi:hypothetical protein